MERTEMYPPGLDAVALHYYQDLNSIPLIVDCCHQEPTSDNSTEVCGASIQIYFRDLERHLLAAISSADLAVGCIAWLTSEPILTAMAALPYGCAVVVQKEDFLRPDGDGGAAFKSALRRRYAALPSTFDRFHFGGLLARLSYCGDPTLSPVRCVGNHNRSRRPAFPRMHNKFLVLCRVTTEQRVNLANEEEAESIVSPYAVWTGSFNFTRNSTASFENAILINSAEAAAAYYREWEQITALSEPLDWESDWCAPEWRVGS